MADTRDLKPGDLLVRNLQIPSESNAYGLNVVLLLRRNRDDSWIFLTQKGTTDTFGRQGRHCTLVSGFTHVDDVRDSKELK